MSFDISGAESVIMEYLWSRTSPARFSEIMEYCNDVKEKNWKKQTVNTFLSRLAKKGLVKADKNHPRALYTPAITKENFHQKQAQETVDKAFGGSIQAFMCAFTGAHRLTSQEKADLLNYLRDL